MILNIRLLQSFFGLSVALMAACGPRVAAQTTAIPDFNGRWELIEYSGDTGVYIGDNFNKMVLAIRHESGDLKIHVTLSMRSKTQTAEFVFYTDGRGEQNLAMMDQWPRNGTYQSVTKWEETKLVTTFKEERDSPPQVISFRSFRVDEWQLAANGEKLVLSTVNRGSEIPLYMSSPSLTGVSTSQRRTWYDKRKFVFRKIA
jgi:hypothetical protein